MLSLLFPAMVFFTMVETSGGLVLGPETNIPRLKDFQPLPESDTGFSEIIARFVRESGLDERTPPEQNPDEHEEWSSICVVDLSNKENPRVGGWEEKNFVYPASAYKLYVLGEAIRQVTEGERSLEDPVVVKEHNVRSHSRLSPGQATTLSEVLRLMMMYSDNTAANEAIDVVDRRRASGLLRAMGCRGSDITRKFLSRTLEDDGYSTVPGTTSSALHFATFLWAVETGAIGGGRGRGLIKGYMSFTATGKRRITAGVPESATVYHKTGTWNTFTSDVALVEDGDVKYIICILTALRSEKVEPRIGSFTQKLHEYLSLRKKSKSNQ